MNTPFYIEKYPDKVKDYRKDIPGNSFENTWPFFYNNTANYEGICIHHTAGPSNQEIDDLAWYHINVRKWTGIGYHFVITPNGIIYYVGDLGVARAHVAGLNDKYIGVCMVGNFMNGNQPTKEQLDSAHLLCEEFINNEPRRFPKINSWDDIVPHAKLTPTACPGDTHHEWWTKLVRGFDNDYKVRYEAEVDKVKDLDKQLKQAKEDFKKAKELATDYEIKYRERGIQIQALESQIEKLEKLQDKLKEAEHRVREMLFDRYTVQDSLHYLTDAITQRRWKY